MAKKYMYICQLSDKEQAQIREDVEQALSDMPWINKEKEVENAMSEKLINLEDTINIWKYC